MAKYETKLKGDFDEFHQYLEDKILESSMSASLEDEHYMERNGIRCGVKVFERFGMASGSRVSLNVTVLADGENLDVVGITSGGSQGLFKLNTFSEETFLDEFQEAVEGYRAMRERLKE